MSKTYALITGASSGIGLEIARQLAARRMHLTLVARSGDVLEEVARELTERFGVDVRTAALDLSESDGCEALERLIEEDERELTLLVNNAGVGAFGSALDVPEERVRTMLRLNIEAVTRLTLFCAKCFKDRGHGRILNIASTGGFQPCPWLAVYGATKAYVLTFSEALAEELKGSGVTVTAFCPGPTRTNFGTAAGLEEDSPFDDYAQDVRPVARAALDAAFRGAPVEIEGWLNRAVAVVAQVAPRSLVRRIAGKLLRKMR